MWDFGVSVVGGWLAIASLLMSPCGSAQAHGKKLNLTVSGDARTGIRRMMIIRTTIDPQKVKLGLQPRVRRTATASRYLVVGYNAKTRRKEKKRERSKKETSTH